MKMLGFFNYKFHVLSGDIAAAYWKKKNTLSLKQIFNVKSIFTRISLHIYLCNISLAAKHILTLIIILEAQVLQSLLHIQTTSG